MTDYNVRVLRTETKEVTITVSAMSASDALHMAKDQAGDIDFRSEGNHVDVTYDSEIES
jgi:hypothetical protein